MLRDAPLSSFCSVLLCSLHPLCIMVPPKGHLDLTMYHAVIPALCLALLCTGYKSCRLVHNAPAAFLARVL